MKDQNLKHTFKYLEFDKKFVQISPYIPNRISITVALSFSNHRDLWCPAMFKIYFIIIDVEIKVFKC